MGGQRHFHPKWFLKLSSWYNDTDTGTVIFLCVWSSPLGFMCKNKSVTNQGRQLFTVHSIFCVCRNRWAPITTVWYMRRGSQCVCLWFVIHHKSSSATCKDVFWHYQNKTPLWLFKLTSAVPAWWCIYMRYASSELKGSRLLERPDKEQWCARGLQTTSCLLVSLQEVTWLLHPAQSGFVLWLGCVWITQNQWRDERRRLLPSSRFLDIKGDKKNKKQAQDDDRILK